MVLNRRHAFVTGVAGRFFDHSDACSDLSPLLLQSDNESIVEGPAKCQADNKNIESCCGDDKNDDDITEVTYLDSCRLDTPSQDQQQSADNRPMRVKVSHKIATTNKQSSEVSGCPSRKGLRPTALVAPVSVNISSVQLDGKENDSLTKSAPIENSINPKTDKFNSNLNIDNVARSVTFNSIRTNPRRNIPPVNNHRAVAFQPVIPIRRKRLDSKKSQDWSFTLYDLDEQYSSKDIGALIQSMFSAISSNLQNRSIKNSANHSDCTNQGHRKPVNTSGRFLRICIKWGYRSSDDNTDNADQNQTRRIGTESGVKLVNKTRSKPTTCKCRRMTRKSKQLQLPVKTRRHHHHHHHHANSLFSSPTTSSCSEDNADDSPRDGSPYDFDWFGCRGVGLMNRKCQEAVIERKPRACRTITKRSSPRSSSRRRAPERDLTTTTKADVSLDNHPAHSSRTTVDEGEVDSDFEWSGSKYRLKLNV